MKVPWTRLATTLGASCWPRKRRKCPSTAANRERSDDRRNRPCAFARGFLVAGSLVGLAHAQAGPQLQSNFANVANFKDAKKLLKLTPAHLASLRKSMFVVTPGGDWQLYQTYGRNDYNNFPSLITTDTVLQLYHVVFDSTLRHVEEHHLYPDELRLAALMLKQSTKRFRMLTRSGLAKPALLNMAYFGVAYRLLGGSEPLEPEARALVARELASIQAHKGLSASTIFPYDIDYSQFIVRGHYSRSEALARYFRSMMWFGLVPISLERRDRDRLVLLPDQVRQAALMVQDLYDSGALPAWQKIYSVSSLYAGESNDLTPMQWRHSATPIVGWPQNLNALCDDGKLRELFAALRKISQPAIVSKVRDMPSAGDVQLRFMGQRAVPDTIAFNRVVDPVHRPWPSSLDIAAMFGSARAAKILDANPAKYNPLDWAGYLPARTEFAQTVRAWPALQWHKNLYMGCLDLIHLNLEHPTPKEPKFMGSPAWADKSISSSLAFWAELRHDTILYGLQETAEQGDGEEPPFVKGYVEPNVPLYQRLLNLLQQTRSGLSSYGYLGPGEAEQFNTFRDTVEFFVSVSKRELNGGKLTKEEHWRLRKIEGDLAQVNQQIQLIGEAYQQLSSDDEDMAEVADVHTSLQKALEVATGHSDDLLAIVPIEGKLYLARGSVLSFYEFAMPVSKRLSDHEWKQMVQTGKSPPRPSWIDTYFVGKSSREKEQ